MPLISAAIGLLCSVSNLLGAINRGSQPTSSIASRVIRSKETTTVPHGHRIPR